MRDRERSGAGFSMEMCCSLHLLSRPLWPVRSGQRIWPAVGHHTMIVFCHVWCRPGQAYAVREHLPDLQPYGTAKQVCKDDSVVSRMLENNLLHFSCLCFGQVKEYYCSWHNFAHGLSNLFSEEDRSHQIPLHDDQLLQQLKVRMIFNLLVLYMRQMAFMLRWPCTVTLNERVLFRTFGPMQDCNRRSVGC